MLNDEGLLSDLTYTVANRTEIPPMWTPESGTAILGVVAGYPVQHCTEGNPLCMQYVPLAPLKGQYVPLRAVSVGAQTFITEDCEDVEFALEFLMKVATDPEIYRVMNLGEENVDWKRVTNPETGLMAYEKINEVFNSPNNKTWSQKIVSGAWSYFVKWVNEDNYLEGTELSGYSPSLTEAEVAALPIAEQAKWYRSTQMQAKVFELNYPVAQKVNPPLFYTNAAIFNKDETEERGTFNTDLKNYFKQQRALFATGQLDVNDDKVWANYIADAEKLGMEMLLRTTQAAYDRGLKN